MKLGWFGVILFFVSLGGFAIIYYDAKSTNVIPWLFIDGTIILFLISLLCMWKGKK